MRPSERKVCGSFVRDSFRFFKKAVGRGVRLGVDKVFNMKIARLGSRKLSGWIGGWGNGPFSIDSSLGRT